MLRVENQGGYKIVHNIPDYTEDEKEQIRRDILQKIYKLASDKKEKLD
jgi:hypothetical protein